MKRMSAFLSILLLIIFFAGCSTNSSKPSRNNKVELSTSNSEYAITFKLNGDSLNVTGSFSNDFHKSVMIVFDKQSNGENTTRVVERKFSADFQIPQKDSVLVEVYAGQEEFGTYESIILDFVKIEKEKGKWRFFQSPVYENNMTVFNKEKNSSDFLGATEYIQTEDEEIVGLSNDITVGISDDYQKVKAIHDWVAENIYYDYDSLGSPYGTTAMDAKSVYHSRKGVCEGYANLVAALVRCQGIPCRLQGGYALGISTDKEWNSANISTSNGNHAWNEAYVNGKWIVVDTTWDSQNKYVNGRYEQGKFITDVYFDVTPEFLALSHKLIEQ